MGKILTDSKRLNIAIILLLIANLISSVMNFIYIIIRVNGFMFITLGVSGIYLLFAGFRKKEKWAWINGLIVVALATFPTTILVFDPTFAMPFPLTLSLLIMVIIALIISYKEFFK